MNPLAATFFAVFIVLNAGVLGWYLTDAISSGSFYMATFKRYVGYKRQLKDSVILFIIINALFLFIISVFWVSQGLIE